MMKLQLRFRTLLLATMVSTMGPVFTPIALAAQVRDGPSPLTREAIRLFKDARYGEARARLLEATKGDSTDAATALYLGRIALEERKFDDAVRWFRTAVQLDGGSSEHHHWLGRAYGLQLLAAGKLRQFSLAKKTRAELETAVALDANNVGAREDLVQYYAQAPGIVGGSMKKAKAHAHEVMQRNALRGHLMNALIAAREKRLEEAERELRTAVQENPDSAIAYLSLARLYRGVGRHADAFATIDTLVARRPGEMDANYLLGSIGAESGERLDRAESALKTYLGHTPRPGSPTLAAAHHRLGQVYQRQGRSQLAREEYAAALSLEPGNSTYKKSLAKVK